MTRLIRSFIQVVALLALGSLGACDDKQSLGSNTLTPSQACSGKRCGDACSACATGSCTSADVVGYCGADGICAPGVPACSPGAGGVVPGTGGAGAGGSGGGTGGARDAGTADGPAQCEYQGNYYPQGYKLNLQDGCNYCNCTSSGFACTGMICGTGGAVGTGGKSGSGGATGTGGAGGTGGMRDAGSIDGPAQCEYQGSYYPQGYTLSLPDGCNYCNCTPAGFECTGMICGTGGKSGTGGTGGTGGAGGTTGTGGSTGTCGDPVVKAQFAACMATKDEQSCIDLGGTWNAFSASDGFCMCPTGEAGCPCTKSTDCLALCAAKAVNNSCIGVTDHQCTSLGGGGGCWCLVGESEEICIN